MTETTESPGHRLAFGEGVRPGRVVVAALGALVVSLTGLALALGGADESPTGPPTDGPRSPDRPLPILDMHLHAHSLSMFGAPPLGLCIPLHAHLPPLDPGRETFRPMSWDPPCPDPIWSPMTDQAIMDETIEVLERRNIVGVLGGPPDLVLRWHQTAPNRFIPSVDFTLGPTAPSPDSLRRLFEDGPFVVLGEVGNQYVGIAPDDERMAPYWALAEELDIPVAIHMGEGPAGAGVQIPTYRARLTSPYLLEEILLRHPRLRVSVMHYGSPLVDEMISMLGAFPQLYVDIGGIQWAYPQPYFHDQLRRLIDAGFGKRVMFGSDQMVWPGVIEPSIAIIEEATFLSEEQKRDIFYNNAARFLRLSEEEIARHHGHAARPGHEHGGEESTNRRSSMVMTVLEARVAPERWEALRASHGERARLSEEVPIVESFLVQADDDPDTWRIVTVWRDRESLEAMRGSGETPTGVLIFRDAHAEPRLSIYTVFANPRAADGSRR
jgi:uncharacterized protein